MDRRGALKVLGAGAGAAVFGGAGAYAQDDGEEKKRDQKQGEHSGMFGKAAEEIAQCANKCNEGFHHCFQQAATGGKQDFARAAHHLVDCAEICRTTATLTARMSTHAAQIHEVCAASCEQSVEACKSLDRAGAQPMKAVVERLRDTARLCRNLSKQLQGSPVTR